MNCKDDTIQKHEGISAVKVTRSIIHVINSLRLNICSESLSIHSLCILPSYCMLGASLALEPFSRGEIKTIEERKQHHNQRSKLAFEFSLLSKQAQCCSSLAYSQLKPFILAYLGSKLIRLKPRKKVKTSHVHCKTLKSHQEALSISS